MIAALFVEAHGVYALLPEIDIWDIRRDACLYPGPYPVVAHPPCARWGNYATGGLQGRRIVVGDDGGCFAAALRAVRDYGGVLEHPEASKAWQIYGLFRPPSEGGWVFADWHGGWTCCVDQGHYGHRAQKTTWLYAHSLEPPSLKWGRASSARLKPLEYLSHAERRKTPEVFRDILVEMAQSVRR